MITAPPLERQRVARSVAVSTMTQLVARGIHLGVNVVIGLALIRYFGPGGYGDYVFVITLTGLLILVSEFGLKNLAVREMALDPACASGILGTVLAARFLTAGVSAALAELACTLFGVDGSVRLAVAVSSLLFLADGLLSITVVFNVALRQEYDAVVRSVMELTELALVIVLIARSAGLVWIVAAPVASATAGAALAIVLARRRFGLRVHVDGHRLRGLLPAAFPLALIGFVGVLYVKLDALLLAAMRPATDVGIYGAAYQPIENLLLTSVVLVNVLFPLAAQAFPVDLARFGRLYRGGVEALVAFALPVPIFLAVFAAPLIEMIYDSRYAPATTPLQVLAVALVLMVVNVWQGFVLVAARRQQVTLVYVTAGIVLNVIVDIPLIARYGPLGAASGTLISAAFLVACSTMAVARATGATLDGTRLLRFGSAGALLLSGLILLDGALGAPWWVAAAVTALAWPGLLRAAGLFSLRQGRELLSMRSAAPALATEA